MQLVRMGQMLGSWQVTDWWVVDECNKVCGGGEVASEAGITTGLAAEDWGQVDMGVTSNGGYPNMTFLITDISSSC